MVEQMLSAIGLAKGATIGGFLGALVSLKFIEGLNWWQRITTLFVGWVCASTVTPLVFLAMELTANAKTELGIGFLIGAFGMSWMGAIVKATPEMFRMALDYLKTRFLK